MKEIEIRRAEKCDFTEMDRVFRAATNAFCVGHYDSEVIESWLKESSPERFAKSEKDGNDQYVMFRKQKLVGFGSVNIHKKLLVSLFVDPSHSGHDLGRKMLDHLLRVAKNANIKELMLDSSLNAVNFYSRNGFVEVSRNIFTTTNGTPLESVQMVRSLV